MPLYRCQACGCVENTATGFYYERDEAYWPDDVRGKALCSACGPATTPDGEATGFGIWHGQFTRRAADGMLVDQNGYLRQRECAVPPSVKIVGET